MLFNKKKIIFKILHFYSTFLQNEFDCKNNELDRKIQYLKFRL